MNKYILVNPVNMSPVSNVNIWAGLHHRVRRLWRLTTGVNATVNDLSIRALRFAAEEFRASHPKLEYTVQKMNGWMLLC